MKIHEILRASFLKPLHEKTNPSGSYGTVKVRVDGSGNLVLELTDIGKTVISDIADDDLQTDRAFIDFIEGMWTNGFDIIPPEAIGALTDSIILGWDVEQDNYGAYALNPDSQIWWFPNYAVESPLQTLKDKGKVVMTAAEDVKGEGKTEGYASVSADTIQTAFKNAWKKLRDFEAAIDLVKGEFGLHDLKVNRAGKVQSYRNDRNKKVIVKHVAKKK